MNAEDKFHPYRVLTKERVQTPVQRKLNFPSWKHLLMALTQDFEEQIPNPTGRLGKKILDYCKLIDNGRNKIITDGVRYYPEFAYESIIKGSGKYTAGVSVDKIMSSIDSVELGNNEFYSVFDAICNEHVLIDSKMQKVLGIPQDKFTMRALCGMDPDNPLHHPEDASHALRFALIAYLILGLPDFEWKAHKDYYRARFRIGTSQSLDPVIRKAGYVMVEKRAYLSHDFIQTEDFLPTRHFDRWIVYDASEFDGIKPYFSSDPLQSEFRNCYWFLLHAYLIGLSPKYLLFLNERIGHDRNKSVAHALNQKGASFLRTKTAFDEIQIGNYFAKTIRPKLSEAMVIWNKQKPNFIISSDQEAVDMAKMLGLLPLPEKIEELIFRNISS
jgi:hypothetical protein